jgi:endonuclease/exonuclease/phosphatase (EEP) superfamily protein YafD
MYNHYAQADRASGGSSIAVHNNYIHSHVNLKTNLQATAVRLSLNKTITLCSIYVPPNYQLQSQELINLIEQLPAPFLFMGDFNAHNPLRGSDKITDKGKTLKMQYLTTTCVF